jgi:hypothetical protein
MKKRNIVEAWYMSDVSPAWNQIVNAENSILPFKGTSLNGADARI